MKTIDSPPQPTWAVRISDGPVRYYTNRGHAKNVIVQYGKYNWFGTVFLYKFVDNDWHLVFQKNVTKENRRSLSKMLKDVQ
jgi:hypothetical protein